MEDTKVCFASFTDSCCCSSVRVSYISELESSRLTSLSYSLSSSQTSSSGQIRKKNRESSFRPDADHLFPTCILVSPVHLAQYLRKQGRGKDGK